MVNVIICGYGTTGKRVGYGLEKHGISFVAIDKNRTVLDGTAGCIVGDATSEEVLKQAGVMESKTVVAVTNSDMTNAFISLMVKDLNKNITVLSTVNDVENINKLDKAGVDYIFTMTKVGRLIAKNAIEPYVADFLEMINLMEDIEIMPVLVSEKSKLSNKSIKKSKIRRNTGTQIIAIRRENDTIYSPSEKETILPGDYILAIGSAEQIKSLYNLAEPEKSVNL
jgi:voltage-gated potassium channel